MSRGKQKAHGDRVKRKEGHALVRKTSHSQKSTRIVMYHFVFKVDSRSRQGDRGCVTGRRGSRRFGRRAAKLVRQPIGSCGAARTVLVLRTGGGPFRSARRRSTRTGSFDAAEALPDWAKGRAGAVRVLFTNALWSTSVRRPLGRLFNTIAKNKSPVESNVSTPWPQEEAASRKP